MKTKKQLVEAIISKAKKEAEETIKHAEGVASYIEENFPDEVPDILVDELEITPTVVGGFRSPEDTGYSKLQRCKQFSRQ